MKGINIKDRNYVLFSGTRSAGKTEEQYFEELMYIIPHKNQFYLSSKEIYDYITKLLKIKKKQEEEIEKLNNIINEFEKWLNEFETKEFNYNFLVVRVKDIQDKLQELKGSDK